MHGVWGLRPELPGRGDFREPGRRMCLPDHQHLAQRQRDRKKLRGRVLLLRCLVLLRQQEMSEMPKLPKIKK